MAAARKVIEKLGDLAPVGSVGVATLVGLDLNAIVAALRRQNLGLRKADLRDLALLFVIEAVGAAPAVTWKYQGSLDSTDGTDGHWYDVRYATDAAEALSAAAIAPAGPVAGFAAVQFVRDSEGRRWRWLRLVVSANVNVTYRSELYSSV